MADFKAAHLKSAKNEGGYANVKNDPGGETYAGITMRDFPKWQGWAKIAKYKPLKHNQILSDPAIVADVASFYKSNFWNKIQGDLIKNQKVAEKLFDMAILMGINPTIKILQRALNALNKQARLFKDVIVDGAMSATGETLKALNSYANQEVVFKVLNSLQGARFIELGERNNKLEDFTEGWFNQRIASIIDRKDTSNIA